MGRTDAKAATRERVIAVAARSLRQRGIAGTGVAAVMAEAGLTHGGFYAHFASKDALTAAAIAASFAQSRARTIDRLADLPPADALGGWINAYLGTRHRDEPERGCALPALSAEVARGDAETRAALGQGFAALAGRLADWLAAIGRTDPQALATSLLTEAIGAVMLARVLGTGDASDALLADTRRSLLTRAGLAA